MNPSLIGAIQYKRLLAAMEFYQGEGFEPVQAPWVVSPEAMAITRPVNAGPDVLAYRAGGIELCPVASAEQSFLQLQMDAKQRGETLRGNYVALTPCFRNELVLDELHQPYFMKVELISWKNPTKDSLWDMLGLVTDFFEQFIDTDEVLVTVPDPIRIGDQIDIVGKRSGIEIGSYGIREHPKVGRWLYGTGLAEPRFSHVLTAETALAEEAKL